MRLCMYALVGVLVRWMHRVCAGYGGCSRCGECIGAVDLLIRRLYLCSECG